jgi:cytidylate kinase
MLIAIDGPAGAGKSTVARAVADALGFMYPDSGAMYRCVALAELRGAADPVECAIGLGERITLDGEDVNEAIRSPEVSALTASPRECARRRAQQAAADLEEVLREQDERDATREHSPLQAARDALRVDTDGLSVEEVTQRIVRLARVVR